jgi:two-component system, NarL family, nitrate/nitrite response regulator NarL
MEPLTGRVATEISVLVADTSRIHTQLLSDALQRYPGFTVVTWDGDPASLIPTALAHRIDVLAIGSAPHGHALDGLRVVRELCAIHPSAKSVVLIDSHQDEAIINSFRAGARGIFTRDGSVEMFCKCITAVHKGEIWAASRDLSVAMNALASTPVVRAVNANGLSLLSKRELDVVQCVVQGLTNQEIADRMGLSRHTIKNYLFRVFDKLGVSNRVELLFITLSQSPNVEDPLPRAAKKSPERDSYEEPTIELFEKAAEQGGLGAQLALAEAYLSRAAGINDLINACTWYLVASERIAQARVNATKMLTAGQLEDAQQKASILLAQMRQHICVSHATGVSRVSELRPAI